MEKHYGIRIEYTFPDAQETTDLVRAKGMFSFYEDGHQECCRVRKVPRASCVALDVTAAAGVTAPMLALAVAHAACGTLSDMLASCITFSASTRTQHARGGANKLEEHGL